MKKRPSAPDNRQRGYLSRPLKLGMLLIALVLAYFLGGRLLPGQTRYIYLSPDQYPPGGIYPLNTTLKKGSLLFIINDAGNYHVLIGTDPSDNCRVRWLRNEQVFASYCSDARYDIHGRWLSGPSTAGLDSYHSFMHRGNLVIDTEERIAGNPRQDT
jgi:hypothetical protein